MRVCPKIKVGSRAPPQSSGLEKRRRFLFQLGVLRHDAFELAENSNFDVNCLEQKCGEFVRRGFRQDEIKKIILYDIHSQSNWKNNITHQKPDHFSQTPSGSYNSTFYRNRQNNSNFCSQEYKDHGNRSESRFSPYENSRNIQGQERYQAPRNISQHFAPFRNDQMANNWQSKPLPGPGFIKKKQHVDFNNINNELDRPSANSTYTIDCKQEISSESMNCCPQNQATQNQKTYSLPMTNTCSNQTQNSQPTSQNQNIPSSLTDTNDIQKASTSKKRKFDISKISQKKIRRDKRRKEKKKREKKEKQMASAETAPPIKRRARRGQNLAKLPVINSGLVEPSPGHSKATPVSYWRAWWPYFKYIENSIPEIDPNDPEIQSCIHFLLKPGSVEYEKRCSLLLNKGIKKIMQISDITEKNYFKRDIFQLFRYKKHLDDPNFQNSLNPENLQAIAAALQQFEPKPIMAYLHQSLIVRWHNSVDAMKKLKVGIPILANYSQKLVNEKSFHYLVMESINELKEICRQDWPAFDEFYRNLGENDEVDIFELGVDPEFILSGFCIKSFIVNTNEKYFINVCQAEDIPSPEDISETQLTAILNSEEPSSFRIPMSISEPRTTKDKSNNPADAVDIAINPNFFVKIEKSLLFRDFFLALIAEALSDKYNVQIKVDKAIILNNRKFIGTLVSHRVRQNDVKTVLSSYQNPSKEDVEKLKSLEKAAANFQPVLVQEIDGQELNELKQKTEQVQQRQSTDSIRIKKEIAQATSTVPDYKLRARIKDAAVEEVQAEFYLPKCISSHELALDIGEDRILLESMKHGYLFDKFVNYRLNQERARAIFDRTNKMLQVRIPVIPAL